MPDTRAKHESGGLSLALPHAAVTDKVAIVAMTDLAGTITYANDLFVQISGYARDELIGANHRILNSGLHPGRFFADMYRTISAGRIWRGEIRNRAKNGSFYWVDTHIVPNLDANGEIEGYTAVRFDITARKQAEEIVRKLTQLQVAILDHAGYAVICTNVEGTIEVFNRAAEEMMGYAASELVGRATPAGFHDPDEVVARAREFSRELNRPVQPGFETFIVKAQLGLPNRHEWTHIRKDGSRFPVLLNVTALRDADDQLTGYLGMVVDISESRERELALSRAQDELQRRLVEIEAAHRRIEAEAAKQVKLLEELAEARDAALAADMAKSRFLATMSHEIRTPMNGVVGVLGLLQSTELTPEQENLVEVALRSANNLVEITSDILDLSKLDEKKADIEAVDFDMPGLASEAVALLEPTAMQKGLSLTCEVDPELPAYLKGDAQKIRQILINLLSNAIKFTLKGGVTLSVGREATRRKSDGGKIILMLRVQDTGIGLDRESVDRLFHRFAQADQSTARRFGGSGLGLAICKQLTELMGGTIGVDSAFGVGSTFWVKIPVSRGSAPVGRPDREAPVADGEPLRVLVAEDNAANQLLIRAMLEAMGHTVTIVGNGAEAVAAATAGAYDAILMDVQMPVMDGPTATQEIRRGKGRSADLPIIALTANALPGDRESYIAAGMTDYLSKPINPAKLLDVLTRISRG